METKPITPKEAKEQRADSIHPGILKIVNDLIIKRCSSSSFTIKTSEVSEPFLTQYPEFKNTLYSDKMLDIEGTYRKAGWKVNYDSPGYNETYEGYWEFKSK